MPEAQLNAIVSQRIEVSPGLIIVRIVTDGWDLPDFKPGQFSVLGLPGSAPRYELSDPEESPADPDKLIKRAYSVSSASVNHEYVEFYITLVRSGALTPRLFHLREGDKLFLSPKFTGMFTLDMVPQDAHILLLATGTGLAPYMSMLRSSLGCNADRKITVVHGARHSWDLGYRSELFTLETICNNFTYLPIISEPAEEHVPWSGHAGFIQELWNDGLIADKAGYAMTPDNTHVFLCGNPLMIENMLSVLDEADFKEHSRKTPGQVHLERYW